MATGFMAGFGPAFAQAFTAGNERRAAEKHDAFKMTYADFLDRRAKKEESEAADRKRINLAKSYARDFAGKEEAWPKIYQWLNDGMSESAVLDAVQNGNFEVDTPSVVPSTPGTPVAASPAPAPNMDQQMAEMGGSPDLNAEPQPEPSIFDRLFKTGGTTHVRRNEAIGKIAQVTGDDVTAVNDIMAQTTGGSSGNIPDGSGIKYKPKAELPKITDLDSMEGAATAAIIYGKQGNALGEELAIDVFNMHKSIKTWEMDEKAKREQGLTGTVPVTVFGEDGKFLDTTLAKQENEAWVDAWTGKPLEGNVMPITKEQRELRDKAAAEIAKPMEQFQQKKVAHLGGIRAAGVMNDQVVATQGAVLAPISSWMAQFAQKGLKEIAVGANMIVTRVAGGGATPNRAEYNDLVKAEQYLQDKLGENIDDLATRRAIFEVQQGILAYHLGVAMGQEGRSLAETERQMFMEMASGGVTIEKFQANMGHLFGNATKTLDDLGRTIKDGSPSLGSFEEQYNYVPREFNVGSVEEYLNTTQDESVANAWKTFKAAADGTVPRIIPDPDTPEVPMQEQSVQKPSRNYIPGKTSATGPDGITYVFKGGDPTKAENWERVD